MIGAWLFIAFMVGIASLTILLCLGIPVPKDPEEATIRSREDSGTSPRDGPS